MEFIKYNNNPKNKITNDCVIRAIALGTNRNWKDIYMELTELGIDKGLMINDKKNWKMYLRRLGYEQQKTPKKENNKRYTIQEFCKELAEEQKIYIISIRKHLTVVKDKNLYDTWNCSSKCMGNYWIKSNKIKKRK